MFLLTIVAGLSATANAQATTWPADSDWIEATSFGEVATDVCGDTPAGNAWDIVSDASNPAVYYDDDGTYLWFRMRVGFEPPAATATGAPLAGA